MIKIELANMMTLSNAKAKKKKAKKKEKKRKRRRRRVSNYLVTNRLKTCLPRRFLSI